MSKTIDFLNQSLLDLLPDPWDVRSVKFLTDGWSAKAELIFTDGENEYTYLYDVFGNDKSDMRHIAVIAVRKLLAEHGW